MPYNPGSHHRRSIRLKEYDYSQNGAYFVTICTHQRVHLFGEVSEAVMSPNAWGRIVEEEWYRTAAVRPYVTLDAFIVMPNHGHGIIIIDEKRHDGPEHGFAPPRFASFQRVIPHSLPAIVQGFKSIVTRRINSLRCTHSPPIWQRNYHEHVIRNPAELLRLQEYVVHNASKWAEDRYYSVP